MLVRPFVIGDDRIIDLLRILTLNLYRDRKPDQTVSRFNAVPVSPVSFSVLHVVIQNEFIDRIYQIEIPSPRDVVRTEQSRLSYSCRQAALTSFSRGFRRLQEAMSNASELLPLRSLPATNLAFSLESNKH